MTILHWLWQTTWQAALLAAVIGIIAFMFRRWLSPQAREVLWLLVFVRLVIPVLPGSPLSVFRLIDKNPKHVQVIPLETEAMFTKQIHLTPDPIAATPASPVSERNQMPVASTAPTATITLFAAWIAGMVLMIAHIGFSTISFRRKLSRNVRETNSRILGIVESCAAECRVRPPTVCVTDLVSTPAVFGILRPKLLLPPVVLARLDAAALRAIVLHELEHLRRRHLPIDLILLTIRAVHWFNPAGWWAHRQIRAARELICDQAVMRRLGRDRSVEYGHALLDVADTFKRSTNPALAIGFFSDKGALRERIGSIASFGKSRYIAGLGLILVITLTGCFLTKPAAKSPQSEAKRLADEKASSEITTRSYYIRDLLVIPSDLDRRPPVLGISWDSSILPANSDDPSQKKARQELVGQYINLIEDTVASDTWQERGGSIGAIHEASSGMLVVTQTGEHHRQIQSLLGTLHSRNDGDESLEAAIAESSSPAGDPTKTFTRVYDVRRLLVYPDLFLDGAKTPVPADSGLRQQLLDKILLLVRQTAPDTWYDMGGKIGSIRELNGQLIITNTQETHRKIAEIMRSLLDQLRRKHLQIVVESQLLRGDAVIKKFEQLHSSRKGPAPDTWLLSDREASDLVKLMRSGEQFDGKPVPRITLFDGQRSMVRNTRSRAYVAAVHPSTNPSDEKSYIPEICAIESGIRFDCQAAASADRKSITLTLRSQYANFLALTPKVLKIGPGQNQAVIQIPEVQSVKYEGTISVPEQQTLAILLHPTFAPPYEKQIAKPMLLLAKPSLIDQK